MALGNYTELKSSVKDWLNRGDLDTKIPEFIALAETKIRRKVRRKSIRATINIASGTVTLPSDCAELRSLHLVTSSVWRDKPFQIGTHEQLADARRRHPSAGRPQFGAVMGGQLFVVPAPDAAYQAEIVYYEKLVPLSDSNPVNSVLTDSADLYLFGTLLQAAKYLEHDERVPTWKDSFDEGLADLDLAREREEYNGSLQPVRPGRSF